MDLVDQGLAFINLILGDNSGREQFLFVESGNGSHLCNLLVHKWLSETGLVEFVVSVFTVPNEIDDYVLLESLSVGGSGLEDPVYVFHAVGIHVEDWCVDSLCQVRRVHS